MAAMIAALLLGAIAPPPDNDDETPRAARTSLTAPPPDQNETRGKPPPSAVATPERDDDDNLKTAVPSESHESEADDEDEEEGRAQPSGTIVITARRLDAARTQIDAALGSTTYSLTNETIENRPGGETGSISDILTQVPGVTLAGKTLSVRGSPANQVRINNVIVPEAISDPADQLSSRLAETTSLITGTLPAQFGFAPAGVISVTTKNGLYQHGGQAELFAGSNGMLEPAFEWTGSAAATSLFGSGSLEHDRSTVVDAGGLGALDRRNEIEGLGFADHIIDAGDRVSMILGGSHERHRFGETGIGRGTKERDDGYAVGTFQHTDDGFTVQASLFGGGASDEARFGDRTRERSSTFGTQIDASDELAATHTLRFGILASRSAVHEIEADLRSTADRTAAGVYAQDEWKITPSLTFNPGARLEWLRGLNSAAEIEPRASLVWASKYGLTAHAGYARYASAVPLGEETRATDLPAERDDYFDGGIQQRLGSLTIGLDGYSRFARDYIAEHETLGSAVPTAFAFKRARVGGVEVSTTYSRGPATAWANMSLTRATAESITSSETLFSPETLAAASIQSVPLASERPVTASGGLTWRLGKLSLSSDVLASSGAVRTLEPEKPNGSRYSPYALFGFAAVYHARIVDRSADLRLDLTNVTNARYFTSNALNLEGGWTRRGQGRSIAIGIEQGF
jgi:outer membrane cobalamin receptor